MLLKKRVKKLEVYTAVFENEQLVQTFHPFFFFAF